MLVLKYGEKMKFLCGFIIGFCLSGSVWNGYVLPELRKKWTTEIKESLEKSYQNQLDSCYAQLKQEQTNKEK